MAPLPPSLLGPLKAGSRGGESGVFAILTVLKGEKGRSARRPQNPFIIHQRVISWIVVKKDEVQKKNHTAVVIAALQLLISLLQLFFCGKCC